MTYSEKQPLRLGFIGGGLNSAVGYTHFNASRMDGHFTIMAGSFSRDREQSIKSGLAYGVHPSRIYENWQELLRKEQSGIDAVVVLTPTPSHAEIVLSAIEMGYPVICEKALGVSHAECAQIVNALEKHKGYLALTYNYSGYPMVRQLRSMVTEGRLGKIQQIHIEMPQEGFLRRDSNPQAWRLSDYAIPTISLDLGVHVHHLLHFISGGKRPRQVVGQQASYGKFTGLIDNVYCMAEYDDDISVMAWWGKTALGYRNGLRIRIYGAQGGAEWYQLEPENLKLFNAEGMTFVVDRGSLDSDVARHIRYNRFKAGHPSGFIEAFANLYVDLADDLRLFKTGKPRVNHYVYGAQDAADGAFFLEKIAQSTHQRKWLCF